jgi:hypothetical protein
MYSSRHTSGKYLLLLFLLFAWPVSFFNSGSKILAQQEQDQKYIEFKGKVVDARSGKELSSALLAIEGSNLSTMTNNDGEFSLKVPRQLENVNLVISHLGYMTKTLALNMQQRDDLKILLEESMEELTEVALFTYTDPAALVRNMLKNRGTNYLEDRSTMTAFYRETIKRGRKNVSLSEAVVTIHKEAYGSSIDDDIALVKARKTADYDRLDTLALKLRGGPYNPLGNDIMKNPTQIFSQQDLENFEFSFDSPTKINEQYLYVVNFEEREKALPWYYGKLFIDAESFSLVKASFNLNVDNRSAASDLFVKKKPGGTKVYPVEAKYDIEYRQHNGRWYYGYGNTELEFVVNWKRRLFNSRYKINSELAVTDWKINTMGRAKKDNSFISPRVVMTDDVSGFADVAFWGENNIIEPDASIENAINKIRNKLNNQ